ncbi:23S rRNA (uridine(2552)-2'-O)-methyltransferase RlmE [Buchnera aphidicola (Hormaphis cornu)]|nr:23S rRNA (uridine(2552)-2'-O)-methyltransferase RlmE [Buchnera aphidicola (Hormaphis cornu)]
MVKKSNSSKRWLEEHFKDHYVISSFKNKLRSRAWFKLEDIDKIYHLINKGMRVIDLGCSPGSWSLYAREKVGNQGKVISCDILTMDPIPGVIFFQGNLRNKFFKNLLLKYCNINKVDLVMSDMAPNFTGISSVDMSNVINLAKLSFSICQSVLIYKGSFLVKLFQGEGFDEYLKMIKHFFLTVKVRKPSSSRTRSRELFIVAEGYKKNSFLYVK